MTSVSKNDYINKLDDIINKYNNTYYGIIKMKPADVNQTHILNLVKKLMIKIQNLTLVILLEFRNIKVFFQKVTNQSDEVLVIKIVKNTVSWTYVISDLKCEEIIGTFYENKLQKPNQKEFRTEKAIRRKGDKLYVKWKGYNNSFNRWINKKGSINELIFSGTKIFRKIRFVSLCRFKKIELKNAIGIYTSSFA